METPPNNRTAYGTAKQAALLRQLASDLGHATPDAALSAIGMAPPLSVPDASTAIDRLKAALEQSSGADRVPAKAADPKTKFLTARHLLLIHSGSMAQPDSLDADAAEVLQRLGRLRDIERVVGASASQFGGMNNGGPISTEVVVGYFGSPEAAAAAFGVSVGTIRAWGTYLPEARAYEAEVKTRGLVCAPRR